MLRRSVKRLLWIIPVAILPCAIAAWALAPRSKPNPDEVWKQAEADFMAGHHDRAEAALVRLKRLREPNGYDLMLRAQVAMVQGRNDDAIADLAKIPDSDPLAAQARLKQGQLELRRFHSRPAEERLLDATRLDPKLVQAHRELVYIYGIQLRWPELNAHFRTLSELVPLTAENAFHWCLTRNVMWEPLEMIDLMKRFVAADPADRHSRLSMARGLQQVHRLDEAEKAVAPLPDSDPDAREIRAELALDRGDEAAAETLLAKGPADHMGLARLRGKLALLRHDAAAARKQFQIAYKLDPENRETLSGMTTALRMLGDEQAAKPYFVAARGQDRLGSLIQRVAVPANREDPTLLRQLGQACEDIHRLPEARVWYNLAIGRDPLDQVSQQALARINAAISAERPPPDGA